MMRRHARGGRGSGHIGNTPSNPNEADHTCSSLMSVRECQSCMHARLVKLGGRCHGSGHCRCASVAGHQWWSARTESSLLLYLAVCSGSVRQLSVPSVSGVRSRKRRRQNAGGSSTHGRQGSGRRVFRVGWFAQGRSLESVQQNR